MPSTTKTEPVKTTRQSAEQHIPREKVANTVADVLSATEFVDVHTHLFSPEFGELALWGIDDLLTYHYLEAELFRFSKVRPEHYWKFSNEMIVALFGSDGCIISKTLFKR